MDVKRVFLIVLDSFGAGEAPDAGDFGTPEAVRCGACRRRRNFMRRI